MSDALFDIEPPAKPVDLVKKPKGRRVAETYDEFLDAFRAAVVKRRNSGIPFTTSQVAEEDNLPEPPNGRSQWGVGTKQIAAEGLMTSFPGAQPSKRRTVHKSLVHVWIGVPEPGLGAA